MSPSEDELRRALHQGEGQPLDVNRIVAAGAAKRAQRRGTLAAASIVGVVALTAITIGLSTSGGESGERLNDAGGPAPTTSGPLGRAGQPSATNSDAAGRPPAPKATPSGSSSDSPSSTTGLCPTSFPRSLAGRGGSTSAPMFAARVSFVLVCAYGSDLDVAANAKPAARTLSGTAASSLAASLDAARRSPSGRTCLPARTQNLVLIAAGTSGKALPPVVATVGPSGCDGRVTNGTALRYGWQPPDEIGGLSPSASGSLPNRSAPGKSHGPPPSR